MPVLSQCICLVYAASPPIHSLLTRYVVRALLMELSSPPSMVALSAFWMCSSCACWTHLQFYSWVATAYAFWLCWHPYQTCLGDATHADYPVELCAEWTTARPRLFYVSLAALTTL